MENILMQDQINNGIPKEQAALIYLLSFDHLIFTDTEDESNYFIQGIFDASFVYSTDEYSKWEVYDEEEYSAMVTVWNDGRITSNLGWNITAHHQEIVEDEDELK